jgi:hypothetical protein
VADAAAKVAARAAARVADAAAKVAARAALKVAISPRASKSRLRQQET